MRKAHKNPTGGLSEAGRKHFNRTTGSNLKKPVSSGDNPRRASFLARMSAVKGPDYKDGKHTIKLLALRKWGASSSADAKKKANAISQRNKTRST